MKYLVVASFVLLLNFPTFCVAQQTAVNRATEFEKIALNFLSKHKVPGLGIAVGRGNDIMVARGFGISDLENAVETTEDTVFRVASISKPMTAVAVLQLVESGEIAIDDPIKDHCPEYPGIEHPPSIRDLLCHQGGIRHYKFPGEAAGKEPFFSVKDSLELFIHDPLLFRPGSRYSYTTFGYSLLGRAIETASGMSYREYMQKNVFDRAGMESAGIDDYFRIIPHRTRGYAKLTSAMYETLPEELKRHTEVGGIYNCQLHDTAMKVPGGGLICSPTDLVKFGQAMLQNKLVSRKTKELAWSPQDTIDGKSTSYGFGWKIENDGVLLISHSGGQAGTSTMLVILPEHDLVIAAMCNLQGVPTLNLVREIGKSILNAESSNK